MMQYCTVSAHFDFAQCDVILSEVEVCNLFINQSI
jgi:hypothetical protein